MGAVGDNQKVWATQSWEDNWNNVIRKVLFKDTMLLSMMMIPEADYGDVRNFIAKYFIRDGMPDALVTNENVRIVYADMEGVAMNIPQIRRRYIAFDIYVKSSAQHNFNDDRLAFRHQLIARRLRYLLTRNKTTEGLSFVTVDDFDLGTKVIGYDRYHLIMEYKKTY